LAIQNNRIAVQLMTKYLSFQRDIANFRSWWEATLQQQEDKQRVVTPLYHYTNATGLLGIIRAEEIWFTSMFHLNDPGELKYGLANALNLLGKLSKAAGPRAEHSFRHFANGVPGLTSIFGYYIASFSRSADDLGQWRAYGDNGRGFAIGLAPRLFHPTPAPHDQQPNERAYIAEVIYGHSNAQDLLSAPIERVISILNRVEAVDEAQLATCIAECWTALSVPIFWYALQTKHEAYSNEQETRLMIQAFREHLRDHIQLRSRGSSLVPFIRHPFPVKKSNAIVEIVVGPAADAMAEDAVKTFVWSEGLSEDVKIRRSHVPYRA
jgi:Protein of unknown function (DUF2971)